MADQIKTIMLSGTAAEGMNGGKKTRRKKKQDGGTSVVKGVEEPVTMNAGSTQSSSWLRYPGQLHPPVIPTVQPVILGGSQTASHNVSQSNTKTIRVELKKKASVKKIHLNPKKSDVQKAKKQTKKSRKITIGISSLHKRITRAKKLHKRVKELPLDKLKEKLIKDGLIKSTSKAPESVLRQIASDSEVVHKRAL